MHTIPFKFEDEVPTPPFVNEALCKGLLLIFGSKDRKDYRFLFWSLVVQLVEIRLSLSHRGAVKEMACM